MHLMIGWRVSHNGSVMVQFRRIKPHTNHKNVDYILDTKQNQKRIFSIITKRIIFWGTYCKLVFSFLRFDIFSSSPSPRLRRDPLHRTTRRACKKLLTPLKEIQRRRLAWMNCRLHLHMHWITFSEKLRRPTRPEALRAAAWKHVWSASHVVVNWFCIENEVFDSNHSYKTKKKDICTMTF